MIRFGFRVFALALLLGCLRLPLGPDPAAGDPGLPHFPRPPALQPNVEFWRQVFSEYGIEEFVLHDRRNLGVVYAVVRAPETADQARLAELAKPEIQRIQGRLESLLVRLAEGASSEVLGPEAEEVFRRWGCPCTPEQFRHAAGNIRAQQGQRQKMAEGMQRARALLPRILPILERHGVPLELAALPLVESAFDPDARSRAGAVGMWQFIRTTGKRYLTITRKRDDRRDPVRSTEAAARYLRHNYERLGSWPLAITAYNHGREGVQAARSAVGSSDIEAIVTRYAGPRFGFASRNFYAEFLAALDLLSPLLVEFRPPPDQTRPRTLGQG